jgi:hypothetical protein
VVVVAVVDNRHDRPGVDQDHAAAPGSVRRMSSTRSARSGSVDSGTQHLTDRPDLVLGQDVD